MSEVIAKVPDGQVMADLDGAVQWAGANGGDLQKPAISGFCWGGCITRLYAAPILKAPVLGLYGEKDGGIPLDRIGKMKIALGDGSAAAEGRSSWSARTRRTPSTPTTAQATARRPRRMAGVACWPGSGSTASREQHRTCGGSKAPRGFF